MKVAVYGSLRQGFHNHPLIEGSEYLGTTMTVDEYTMYDLGSFPAVCLTFPYSQIVVEVYDVDESTMFRLNRLEGYRGEGMDNFYDRSLVETEAFGACYMYHTGPMVRSEVVRSGDWVQAHQKRQSA